MNVVDSSGWLAYFAGDVHAGFFAPAIEAIPDLIVPTITLTEVFKVIQRQKGEGNALLAIAHMEQGQVIDLNRRLALDAANWGLQYKLPLADSIIYATAIHFQAILWTQDRDFEGLPHVQYRAKVP
ncbi:MAG: type II toxin-antitoxin system VapC family toxin [Acidobacteria bacterium]|nr:type II toxin-antitoxin system VapC family toxin [Acidobacteriota bacterium]MCB9399042.1 type II toxin-antitoxin system VapC family toxin [Acidobacteriota bacterium]